MIKLLVVSILLLNSFECLEKVSEDLVIDSKTTINCETTGCGANQRCELKNVDEDCLENCNLEAICVDKVIQNKCKENEQLRYCGTPCEPTCDVPDPEFCTKQCLLNVCQCSVGFVRDLETNKCVTTSECKNNSSIEKINEKEYDEIRKKMCNKECGNVTHCYIHTTFDIGNKIVHTPICLKGSSQQKTGSFHVEPATPIPVFHPKLLVQPTEPKPQLVCSIKCDEGKRCEIVDLPCFQHPCPEIDVCVDDI